MQASLLGEAKNGNTDSHVGKGITDQDRNILSNQLLVLAFLRSAASVLATGPIPTIFKPRKRKGDEDEDESDDDNSAQQELEDEDEFMSNAVEKTRGSILITLRNVSPYTLWCVSSYGHGPCIDESATGMCRDWLRSPHRRQRRVHHIIHSSSN